MARAARHFISLGGHPWVTVQWVQRYGYRAAVSAGMGASGILFQRLGEELMMAVPGDTLRWDGRRKCIVIEPVCLPRSEDSKQVSE